MSPGDPRRQIWRHLKRTRIAPLIVLFLLLCSMALLWPRDTTLTGAGVAYAAGPTASPTPPPAPTLPASMPRNWGPAQNGQGGVSPQDINICTASSNYTPLSGTSVVYGSNTQCTYNGPTIGTQTQLWWYDDYQNNWVVLAQDPQYGLVYCGNASTGCPISSQEYDLLAGWYQVRGQHYCSICYPQTVYSSTSEFYLNGQ